MTSSWSMPPEQRLAAGSQVPRHLGEPQRRADAVLVPHQRPDGVAERLLVAEHEGDALALGADRRVGDPLEAGERLAVAGAAVARHARQQARGHDGRDDQLRPSARVGVLERVVGEQHADLVAREHPVAAPARVGHRGREPVGVRVVGEHELGARLGGEREHAVHGARLLGVREGHGAEGAVGIGLRRLGGDALEPGPGEGADREPVADAVHRRVGDAQRRRPRPVQRRSGEAVEIGLLDGAVARVHERAQAASPPRPPAPVARSRRIVARP